MNRQIVTPTERGSVPASEANLFRSQSRERIMRLNIYHFGQKADQHYQPML